MFGIALQIWKGCSRSSRPPLPSFLHPLRQVRAAGRPRRLRHPVGAKQAHSGRAVLFKLVNHVALQVLMLVLAILEELQSNPAVAEV